MSVAFVPVAVPKKDVRDSIYQRLRPEWHLLKLFRMTIFVVSTLPGYPQLHRMFEAYFPWRYIRQKG
jgi:hypothetical protein